MTRSRWFSCLLVALFAIYNLLVNFSDIGRPKWSFQAHVVEPKFLVAISIQNEKNISKLMGSTPDRHNQSISSALRFQASDLDQSCPSLGGRTEWLQLRTWLTRTLKLATDVDIETLVHGWMVTTKKSSETPQKHSTENQIPPKYRYNVTYQRTEVTDSEDFVKIFIHEHSVDGPSSGGTTFRVNVTSDRTSQVCPWKDYLDGSYMVCCLVDTTFIKTRYNVEVFMKLENFTAYSRLQSTSTSIWSEMFEIESTKMVDQNFQYSECKLSNIQHRGDGYWLRSSEHMDVLDSYVLRDASSPRNYCTFPINHRRVVQCFKDKFHDGFTMIGDSHMRYAYYYLMQITTGPAQSTQVHHDLKSSSHEFKWRHSCAAFNKGIQKYLKSKSTSKPKQRHTCMLLLGTGAHNMKQQDVPNFLDCLLNKTYPILEALQKLPLTSVVWQEMPPTADYHQRNNYISDAVNYFIKQLLAPLNITVIPSSAISKVWSENLGSMKTHLFDVTNKTLVVLPPGNVVTYMLAYSLCEDFR